MKSPLITMIAITGKPTKSYIYDYMKSLKDNGIEQAMLYPRSGCETEYLSEEWFSTIGHFIDSAKELDMYIWLYDDFNWPSGDAGGRVTAVPEYRLKAISTRGDALGQITHKSQHNAGLFGEKFFPDLLSAHAVEYFIKCTHEEYYKRFASYFGAVIKGIFTDEPSIGYCCKDGCIPYYDGIGVDYFDFCGRDFFDDMKNCHVDFYLNAISVISERFRTNYIERLRKWCDSHNILMTGHLLCDDEMFWTVQHNGRLLKNLSHFALPGIDDIETYFDSKKELALFGVIEYASGENGAMAELFALGPCDMSYAKKRAMIYFAACHKINHYFLAISHLDMRGNYKVKDYFNDISPSQPDFLGMKELSREAKAAAMLTKMDYTPDVYIRYPYDICAKNVTEWIDFEPLYQLINTLTYRQIQWKYTDGEEERAPVIEFNENGEITLDKNPFDMDRIPRKITVTDENNDTPTGIFVRRFDNGEVVVINLFAEEKEYFIEGKKIFLGKYDVYSLKPALFDADEKEICASFKVRYRNENLIRAMHVNSADVSKLCSPTDTEVSFFVRKDTDAYLNGEKIRCPRDADELPFGMRNLYMCSDKCLLKSGTNTISTSEDLKYLPSVLISGDFCCRSVNGDVCKVELGPRKTEYTCKDKIYDYGAVEFTAELLIPKGALRLELYGTDMLTQVYLNGALLGDRAFAPYEFDIPREAWGKNVELKIVQYSSIAPIFGDVDFWDKTVESCGWRGTPSTENKHFGFSRITFKTK
ncbi:MAG: hypothetical protein IJ445_06525 [Clostridia bacterium]|nr:hypothetical protein [Clostridia bacterium]